MASHGRGARNTECIAKRRGAHTNLVYAKVCPCHSPPNTNTDKVKRIRNVLWGVSEALPRFRLADWAWECTEGTVKTPRTLEASNSRE